MSAPAPQRRKKIDGAGKEAHPSSAQARGSSFSALHFMKALFSAAQPFRMSLWHAYRFRCVGILAAWNTGSTMAQSSVRTHVEVALFGRLCRDGACGGKGGGGVL